MIKILQSKLSYATLQGTETKRSHLTGGLLIQSPYHDHSENYVPHLTILKINRNDRVYPKHIIMVQLTHQVIVL